MFGLPEVDFGFQPELLQKLPETRRSDLASSEVIAGLDSTSPVKGRIEELRKLLAEVEEEQKGQLEPGRKAQSSASSSGTVDALKRVTETRWKAFAEGLGLSSKRALETLEVLDGSLFYVPYFIAKFSRGSETRYLAWDRNGREDNRVTLELVHNTKFRDLVESRLSS